jgi:deazaflavin-dependent oxidoreductase (nitroreductase family)
MREGDRLFLVGSNYGQANHPAWSWNLLADANAWVTMGGHEIAVAATQLTGAEHDRIFRKFADYAANYDAYRGRTDRKIRVFELTRR